jgi:damage-control phosphatase, subfamily III
MLIKIFLWYGVCTSQLYSSQNDLNATWEVVSRFKDARIDIVLDNAGFELYADLIFTSYLLSVGMAGTVILHPKSIPWYVACGMCRMCADPDMFRFVSDVTPRDIGHLFSCLSNPAYFGFEARPPALDYLVGKLTEFYREGRIIIRCHDFWTTQHSYWRLPSRALELLRDLEQSDLVIFKGDLNYRKYVLRMYYVIHMLMRATLG